MAAVPLSFITQETHSLTDALSHSRHAGLSANGPNSLNCFLCGTLSGQRDIELDVFYHLSISNVKRSDIFHI